MDNSKEVKSYKLLKLPSRPIKNAVLYVLDADKNEVVPYVTDANGVATKFKDSDAGNTDLSTENTPIKLEIKSSSGASAVIPKEDVEALELDAKTVNTHTIEKDVPSDALFTDTIYDDTAIRQLIADIEQVDSETVTIDWAGLVARANKKSGDKFNITDSKTGYPSPMGVVTLLSATTFIWVDSDGFEITVNIE